MRLEVITKKFRETLGIIALHILEHCDLFRVQLIEGKLCHYRSLKRVDETDAEDIVPYLRYFWIG